MDTILTVLLSLLGTSFVSSLISAFFKDHSNNKYWKFFMDVVNILALNIKRAQNDITANK